jgi:formylglycine-generating enzyme required for sulfatase activity
MFSLLFGIIFSQGQNNIKKLLFLISLFILVSNSYAQEKVFPITQTNKRFVKVDEKMYVDKFEVTVQDYVTFLDEAKKNGRDMSILMYDSNCWREIVPARIAEIDYYFSYSSYRNYPILGISNFAAQEFCKWLTEKYNADPNRKFTKVVFRLPTEQEFVKVALSIYDTTKSFYPWGYQSLYNRKHKKNCNFLEINQFNIDLAEGGCHIRNFIIIPMTEPVCSYLPNPYGVYNIVGNVSEMIQEDHYAMGGDYLSTGYNVRICSKKYFREPTSMVGFRVYMEVIN